jgi:replicative DNA helicase
MSDGRQDFKGDSGTDDALRAAQRAALGCMLRDNSVISAVLGAASPSAYDDCDAHFRIACAIRDMHAAGRPVDTVTLADELRDRGEVGDIGGYAYLGELWTAAPAVTNAQHYAAIIHERAVKRRLHGCLLAHAHDAGNGAASADVIDALVRDVVTLRGPAAAAAPAYDPGFLTSAQFAAAEYRLEWLVKGLLVRSLPAVLGGPKKALKTSLLVDLALSLGTGSPFLGKFAVPQALPVALISGESGQPTLQDTARRVAAARGLRLADAGVLWGFRLPQLTNPAHLAALSQSLRHHGVKVLAVDPLYLCLLAGAGNAGPQASNVYQMGPLLLAVAEACQEADCSLILAHHFKLTRPDPYGEPQLDDLAFAGVQEFARQWVLVGRRAKYQEGSGKHELWLSAGGSAGQSGLWALTVEEGTLGEDFRGRTWDASLTTASMARQATRDQHKREKARQKAEEDQEDEIAVLAALDQLDPNGEGAGREQVRDIAALSRRRMTAAVLRLKVAKTVRAMKVQVRIGSGGTREVDGLVRCRND